MFFTTQRRPAHLGAGADVPDTRSRQDGGPVSDHDHDDQITLAVDAVWQQLLPGLEQHFASRAVPRRHRHARRAAGFGLAVALVGTGGAVAARALLGEPAPP